MPYRWDWEILLRPVPSGEATYLGWMLAGLAVTVALSLSAWLLALAVGTAVGVARTGRGRLWPALAAVHVEVFRNVPLLVQLFVWYFVVPELLPAAMGDAVKRTKPVVQQFVASALCLGLFTSARVAEQVRAGIESLPRGQRDAGLALGLSVPRTYRRVLLPMAFRIVVPPLTSEMLNVFKNSAVCSTIGLLELSAQGRQLVDYTAQPYESFIAVTLLYLLLDGAVMWIMRRVERRARVPGYLGTR